MKPDWQELLARLLDGGELGESEAGKLSCALEDSQNHHEAEDLLAFEACLQVQLMPEGSRMARSMDRLVAKAALRAERRSLAVTRKPRPWLSWCAAAAVLLIAVGLGIYFSPRKPAYPSPALQGDFRLLSETGEPLGQGAPVRGRRVIAGPGGARLSLGGYCELSLDATAEVLVQGSPQKEEIALETGRVVSRVTPQKGAFRVVTPRGALDVRGTEFTTTVRYPDGKREDRRPPRKSAIVAVTVVAGAVGYDFGTEQGVLGAGMSKAFGEEPVVAGLPDGLNGFMGCLSGKIVEKGEAGFVLQVSKVELAWPKNKAEKPEAAVGKNVRFRVNVEQERHRERLARVTVGDDVVAGGRQGEGNFLVSIEVLVPAADFPALKAKWEKAAQERREREAREREERERREGRKPRAEGGPEREPAGEQAREDDGLPPLAPTRSGEEPRRAPAGSLEKVVSVSYENVLLRDVCQDLTEKAGIPITCIGIFNEKKVTYSAEDEALLKVLNGIAARIGSKVYERDGGFRFRRPDGMLPHKPTERR